MESQITIHVQPAAPESSSEDSNNFSNRKNENTNPIREEFNKFVDNLRLSSRNDSEGKFDELLNSLKIKNPSIYSISQLSKIFESLLFQGGDMKRVRKNAWTDLEDNFLISIIAHYCILSSKDPLCLSDNDWQYLESIFPKRQASQIAKRWKSIVKVDLKQNPWTPVEDEQLKFFVEKFGAEKQWKKIAEKVNSVNKNGVFRQSRQCRERWINYVNPNIQKGDWSREEDLKLLRSFLETGKKWAEISKTLGNRTENSVRNRLISLIKKEIMNNGCLDENLSFKDEAFELKIAQQLVEKLLSEEPKSIENKASKSIETNKRVFQGLDKNLSNYQIFPQFPQQQIVSQNYFLPYQTNFNCSGYFNTASQLLVNTNVFSSQLSLWPYFEAKRLEQLHLQQALTALGGNQLSWAVEPNRMQINRKASSGVFYAIVDANNKQVRIIDKVPQENLPKFM